jgi:hypothetical protein
MPSKTKKAAPTPAAEPPQPAGAAAADDDDDVSMPDADAAVDERQVEAHHEDFVPALEGQRIQIVCPVYLIGFAPVYILPGFFVSSKFFFFLVDFLPSERMGEKAVYP